MAPNGALEMSDWTFTASLNQVLVGCVGRQSATGTLYLGKKHHHRQRLPGFASGQQLKKAATIYLSGPNERHFRRLDHDRRQKGTDIEV